MTFQNSKRGSPYQHWRTLGSMIINNGAALTWGRLGNAGPNRVIPDWFGTLQNLHSRLPPLSHSHIKQYTQWLMKTMQYIYSIFPPCEYSNSLPREKCICFWKRPMYHHFFIYIFIYLLFFFLTESLYCSKVSVFSILN